jgi:hypothetical protein
MHELDLIEELSNITRELEIANSYRKEERDSNNSFGSTLMEVLATQKKLIKKQSDLLEQQLLFVKSQNEIIEKQKILLNAQISSRNSSTNS